jgi:hypothetical protein
MSDIKPTPGKSLAELENDAPPTPPTQIVPEKKDPVLTPAPPETPPADPVLTDEQKAAAAAVRLDELKAKDPATLTAEEKTELEAAAADEDPGDDEGDFWEDVDKLRGEKIEIDWSKHIDGEGNPVDPLSPAGVLIREKHVAQLEVAKFEESLEKSDPRGYAYLLHRQAGGTDEDFFSKKTITLPEYEAFKESVDLQQKVYRDDLLRKGLDPDQVKLLVEQAVKDKKILELADKAYKQTETAQQQEIDRLAKQLEEQNATYENSVKQLTTMLNEEISSNSSMKLLVPDAKKADFNNFVRKHIQSIDGSFYAVQQIDPKTLSRILDGLYLQFVNGDISGLIQRAAATQNTNRLKRAIQSTRDKQGKTTPAAANTKKTLGEL